MPAAAQTIYSGLFRLGAPLLRRYLNKRAARGKEITARLDERYGRASVARPAGKLIWLHGASVGESLSLLPLVERLRALPQPPAILMTSGTVASAKLLAQRLPPGCIHQFIPLDHPRWVARFLDHWRPNGVLWVESDLWPGMLSQIRRRGIPAALVNMTLSPESARRWLRLRGWAQQIVDTFMFVAAQTMGDAERWHALGGGAQPQLLGNLKFVSDPLPYNAAALAQLHGVLGERPVWIMASAHPGEETVAGNVHRALQDEFPDLLTVIVPRHPARGTEFKATLQAAGFTVALRSVGEMPDAAKIYIADTLGELGLFYRLTRLVVVGGSFVPIGGHNPIEPAQCGALPHYGPHMFAQSAICAAFEAAGAARPVVDATALTDSVRELLQKPQLAAQLGEQAQAVLATESGSGARIWDALADWRRTAGLS